jgi:hypothetical protein
MLVLTTMLSSSSRTDLGGLGGAGVGLHGLQNLQESVGPVFVSLQISHHTSAEIIADQQPADCSGRLSISQSTVSRRVQLFERQLGFSLFKRTRAGAGLTPEGERFLQQAVVGARYLRNAATEIRSARKLKTGLVRFVSFSEDDRTI